jgi:outer membrane receptor for ferrienterochelin and colicins
MIPVRLPRAIVRNLARANCAAIAVALAASIIDARADDTPDSTPVPAAADAATQPPAAEKEKQKDKEKDKDKERRHPRRDVPGDRIEGAEIVGHHDPDTDERRRSTASKMVFGREELDRYGDTSIGEVLKRLPGITISGRPGRGGDIRMRGLGHGYTQILLNGEPTPRGFSLDTLAPEQVERIEIFRAPIAEHSGRGIAGTINVVLREDYEKQQNEVRMLDTVEQGHSQPGISVLRSDTVGNFGYNVTINAFGKNQGNEIRTSTTAVNPATGARTLDQQEFDDSRTIGEGVHATSRLTWHFENGDTLNLQPFLTDSRSQTPGNSTLAQAFGPTPAPYSFANWLTDSETTMARLFGNYQHRFDGGSKLLVRAGYGEADTDTSTLQNDYDAGDAPSHVLFNSASIHDRSFSSGGKYSLPVARWGEVATGWDFESGQRSEDATTIQDGVVQLAEFGPDVQASTTRVAFFGQDEWSNGPHWSSYAGLRWEGIQTTSNGGIVSVSNTSSVWSPLLHTVYRFSEENRDQVRLSLTRSYRAPTLANLIARPTLSTLYPADGTNSPTSPDKVGNPELRPELAWGLDAAFEHYLDQGGILSASVFHRSIDDLIRSSTSLQTVSWSPAQRWVNEPQNIGHASAYGVELEAKFRVAELFDGLLLPLDLRLNYSRFWSAVDAIPGPNNRLDQQPKQTANIGMDYRLRSLPLTLGGNLNWTPAYAVQQSPTQVYLQGLKQVFDCYALWRFSPAVQLRLAAANLLHRDYLTGNEVIADGTDQLADVVARTYIAYTARLEIKF